MASIEQRTAKDGTVSYLVTVSLGRDQEGKKIRRKATFIPTSKNATKAKKELDTFVLNFENSVLNGDIVVDERATFSDLVQIWENNWLPAKTLSVQQGYKNVLQQHVIPHIGHLKLTTIRASHIDTILKNEEKAGLAAATVRRTFTVINSVFKYAYRKGYLRENPCQRCDELPQVTVTKGDAVQYFTPDQSKRFLEEALRMEYDYQYGVRHRINKSTGEKYEVAGYVDKRTVPFQWRVYFTMAILAGCRRSEMLALTWSDFDAEANTLSITKALAGAKGEQYLKGPKTQAGNRIITIPEDLTALLRELKCQQLIKCMEMGTAWMGHRNGPKDSFDNNTIFIRDNGQPMNLATPGHKFHEVIDMYNGTKKKEEDKLPHIRLHDLRHTHATTLIANGLDYVTVSKRMGHSKPSVTVDIYSHALPENDKRAADILGRLLG